MSAQSLHTRLLPEPLHPAVTSLPAVWNGGAMSTPKTEFLCMGSEWRLHRKSVKAVVSDSPVLEANSNLLKQNYGFLEKVGLRDMSVDETGQMRLKFERSLTVEEYAEFIRHNGHLKVGHEGGDLLVVGTQSRDNCLLEVALTTQLYIWNAKHGYKADVFGSRWGVSLPSSGSSLYNMADVAVALERKATIKVQGGGEVSVGSAEFILELASGSDMTTRARKKIKESLFKKMQLYGEDGCQLGYIFDPFNKVVWKFPFWDSAFDPKNPIPIKGPQTGDVTGDDVLPNFILNFEDLQMTGGWPAGRNG